MSTSVPARTKLDPIPELLGQSFDQSTEDIAQREDDSEDAPLIMKID